MIECKNICKYNNKECILKDINCKFSCGKIYGIIGENSVGKSLLLKVITGIVKPYSGEVIQDNISITKKNIFLQNARAMINEPEFTKGETGYSNLETLAMLSGSDPSSIDTFSKKIGLEEYINVKVREYSLGSRKKLGIIQTLIDNPKIIILDEPFSGLDLKSVEKVKKVLLEEKNKGKIIIITSHLKKVLEEIADKLYKIENKTLQQL